MCGISDIGHLGRLCVCVLFGLVCMFLSCCGFKVLGFAKFVCFVLGGG